MYNAVPLRFSLEQVETEKQGQRSIEIIIRIIIRKLLMRTCSQALSMNRRCGNGIIKQLFDTLNESMSTYCTVIIVIYFRAI